MSLWVLVVGFLVLDVGIVLGWCLKGALVRAQGDLPTRPTTKSVGQVARWVLLMSFWG